MKRTAICLLLLLSPGLLAEEKVRIISFSDFHGALAERAWFEDNKPLGMWGPAEFAAFLDAMSKEWPGKSLIVSNGDDFQGTLISNLAEGKPVVDFYNRVGVSLSGLGNHDFDYGPSGPEISTPQNPGDDPLGALRERMKQARYDFVVANLKDAAGHLLDLPKLHEYRYFDFPGLRIAFLGLITPQTPNLTNSANLRGVRFASMTEETLRLVPEMRKAGAQIIVVLAHSGAVCTGNTADTCPPHEEIIKYANSLPPGFVELIISGHSHSFLNLVANGIPIIQAGSHGRGVAVSDFTAAGDGRIHPSTRVYRVPEMKALIGDKRDESVLALLRPYEEKLKQLTEEVLGELTVPLTREGDGETTLGAFVADRLKESVPGADMAFINKGGLRADLQPGKITYGQVYDVLPFDNDVAAVRLNGKELKELIRLTTNGAHGLMQVAGIVVALDLKKDLEKEPRQRNRVIEVRLVDGTAIEDARQYTVVTSDFLLKGGDDLGSFFEKIPEARKRFTSVAVRDCLVNWLRKNRANGPIRYNPPETRVRLM